MPKRHSNRGPFENRPVPGRLLTTLQAVAWEERTWLHLVQDEEARHAVADLIAEGDRIQLADKRFRRELASWVHPNRTNSRDGMPGYAFGDLMSLAGPFAIAPSTPARDRRRKTGNWPKGRPSWRSWARARTLRPSG